MRKVSLEKEAAIIETADALVVEGTENPTNDQVRGRMGGGSIADISPVMRKWREERKQEVAVQLIMPDAVKSGGERFATQLWAAADNEARKQLDELRKTSQVQVTAAETERDEVLAEIQQLETDKQALSTDLEAAQKLLQQIQERVTTNEQTMMELRIKAEASQVREQAAQDLTGNYKEQLQTNQVNMERLQKELVELAKRNTGPKKAVKTKGAPKKAKD